MSNGDLTQAQIYDQPNSGSTSKKVTVEETCFFTCLTCLGDLEFAIQLMFNKLDNRLCILHWPSEKIQSELARKAKSFVHRRTIKDFDPFDPFTIAFVVEVNGSGILCFCLRNGNQPDLDSPDYSFCYR